LRRVYELGKGGGERWRSYRTSRELENEREERREERGGRERIVCIGKEHSA
jgi:hypothetical protein